LATDTGSHEIWKPRSEASLDEALSAAEQLLRDNRAADAARDVR